jgi:hypothetical protein
VGLVNALVPTPELTRLSVRGLPSTTYRILLRRGRGTPLMDEVLEALRTVS